MNTSKPVLRAGRKNAWGGSAGAGGVNLHARVAAVIAVHLFARRPLAWLNELENDVPLEIWCETNGPGDDLRFVLEEGKVVEAQVKKGLNRGTDLWTALEALARGVHIGAIAYGVLVVDIDASTTVRCGLAKGLVRMGEGRTDDLDDITLDFKSRLTQAGIPIEAVCGKLRIVVVHCANNDDATLQVAIGELRRVCVDELDAPRAWAQLDRSAHGLIERRGRWTQAGIEAILRAAGANLVAAAKAAVPMVGGFAWEHFDRISPYRGLIQAFRQHYLLTASHGTPPFGGRDAELDRLNRWLFNRESPSRMLVHAPTARGKSALLVHWTEQLVTDATWTVVFVPISLRFGTDRPATYYSLLAAQMAQVLKVNLPAPTTDQESHYLGVCSDLMLRASEQGRHILIVVDGLDESHGRAFSESVFPRALPSCIKILVSAREQAGDRGAQGWLQRLSWGQIGLAATENLAILGREAVVPILASAGIPLLDVDDALVDRLMTLTTGEPLLLSLYAEDLAEVVRKGDRMHLDALAGQAPGFGAYFSRAFAHADDSQEIQEVHNAVLAVLAMAMGPLQAPRLTDLVCQLVGVPRPFTQNTFVTPLKRFIAGDGSAEHGYVLNHPKLGEYMREERFDSTALGRVEQAFLDWGRREARSLEADPQASALDYVLQRHVDHLRRAGPISLDDAELLLTDGWRQAWFRLEKEYAGYADSLIAASGALDPSSVHADQATRALRVKIAIALRSSSVKSQGINVPAELLALALRARLVTLRQALEVVRLQMPENRLGYRLALAPDLPDSELARLFHDIRGMEDGQTRVNLLARLAPHVQPPLRAEIAEEVRQRLQSECLPAQRRGIIAQLAPALDNADLESLLNSELVVARGAPEAASAVVTLAPLIDLMLARGMALAVERLIAWCQRMIDISQDTLLAVDAMAALAARAGADKVQAPRVRLTPLVNAMIAANSASAFGAWDFEAGFRRGRIVKAEATLALLEIALLPIETYRTRLAAILQPLMQPDYFKVEVLQALVPLVRIELRQEVAQQVVEQASQLPTANNRTHALMRLAQSLQPVERRPVAELALRDARRIEDEFSRGLALVALFSKLPVVVKEQVFPALMHDISQVRYVLHQGQLLFEVADQVPAARDLAIAAVQLTLRAQDIGNSETTLLREIKKVPERQRAEVFAHCWTGILRTGHTHAAHQVGFAARWAPEFWTLDHLRVARELVKDAPQFTRVHVLADLLAVAARLGETAFMEEAIGAVIEQDDPNEVVSNLARVINFLGQGDPRRALLRHTWLLAAATDKPNVNSLILGFEQLDSTAKQEIWPKLVACARAAESSAQHLARISKLAHTPGERSDLLRAALDACASEKPDARIAQAAQIAEAAEENVVRLRALDLMSANPDVSRSTFLSALGVVAPALVALDASSLNLAVMDDIRQCADWWP